ncbi:acyl-CoA dehydratase activase-related protein [Chloroflexota bacterium]
MRNKIRIGIPQAMLYYQYLPMWKAFFEKLGAEIVVSPPTTKEMVSYGCSRIVGDVCLPVKVFCGHAHSLIDKCDYLFIPSIHSVPPKAYNCPKFIGLPDIVRANVPGCPPILDPDIDVAKSRHRIYKAIYKMAQPLTRNPLKVRNAYNRAIKEHRMYRRKMQSEGLTPPQVIGRLLEESGGEERNTDFDYDITVSLVGHPYLVHDRYVNHDLVHRLQKMGVKVVFSSAVSKDKLQKAVVDMVEKKYWGYEEEITGAGGYYLESDVDGIISVVAFGCGPDSMMMELLQRRAAKLNKPFLPLVLDEHTADVGLVTRLEAFIDMVRRQDKSLVKQTYVNRINNEPQGGVSILGIPNMAHIAPAFRTSLAMVGATLINPPVTRQTITLGARHSPEFACLPFKGILGTFIESLEMGAESLFMVTSSNACRMGYYSKVHEQILRDLGYEFRFLRATEKDKGLIGILRAVKRFANTASWPTVIAAYRLGAAKLKALDDLERKAHKCRAVEMERGKTNQLFREAMQAIDDAPDLSSLKQVVNKYFGKLDHMPKNLDYSPLRVGIIGELYVVMDPYINMNLESKLGMLGVEVRRTKTTFFSEWTNLGAYLSVLDKEKNKLQKHARPYLKRDVGGHGLESVGEKVRLGREGYDGIVHLAPFTCMPEAIAQNVMLNTREDIPVLTLLCDEQMGEAGMITRLEAFVDLIERRRKQRQFSA